MSSGVHRGLSICFPSLARRTPLHRGLVRGIAEHPALRRWRRDSLRLQTEMTHGTSDGRDGVGQNDGSYGRRAKRLMLRARASQAIHRAHVASQGAAHVRELSGDNLLTALENRALIEAELEAMRKLESDVRRFADALRAQGTPPEVAVRRLKATVDPVVYSSRDHDGPDVEWRRAVAGDVMRWFVEAYYAA